MEANQSRVPRADSGVSVLPFDLVVIAASTGGVHALSQLLGDLPADFPVPIAVVQHRSASLPDRLPQVLQTCSRLHVTRAGEGILPRAGWVYLAPLGEHLVVRPDRHFGVEDGRRIRFLRSAVNPLFETAALALHGRVLAVVLTGKANDATDGVQAVKARGGTVIAQDQATSVAFDMPRSAISTGAVDHVLPLSRIGPALIELVQGRSLEPQTPSPAVGAGEPA